MQFARVESGKVVQILSASGKPPGATALPRDHEVLVGDDVRFFDAGWRRKSARRCADEGLIDDFDERHSVVRWKGGKWEVKADYTRESWWYKDSGEQVVFSVGDEPDREKMTDAQPPDFEAKWDEESGWYVPREVKARRVREERDELLRGSDYTMLEDVEVDKKAWKEYRQALRDMSLQKSFPDEVSWPKAPDEGSAEEKV